MKKTTNYKKLEENLKTYLFDQDYAIESISQTLLQSDILSSKSNVRSIFTFIGSPNSGKHYLCELLEQNSEDIQKIKTFYMDQYNDFSTSSDSLSSDYFKNEILTFVQAHPNSILVFEDFEKADLQIQLILYTLFSDYEKI